MLKRFNIIRIEAVNGEDAVNIVKNSFNRNSNFDIELILMDLNMPIMGGVESTQKIRELEKEYKRVTGREEKNQYVHENGENTCGEKQTRNTVVVTGIYEKMLEASLHHRER